MARGINLVGVAILMGLALLAAVVVTGRITDRGVRHSPSIVLLVLDTVRADHLSALGYRRPTSPHLDRVRDEGTVFTRAWAPAPWTLPVHASLFTGLQPAEHGCHWEHRFLTEAQETLAERLQARGYVTGGFTANVNVSHFFNLDQGFETFVEIWRERRRQLDATDSEITNQEIVKWLDGISDDRPFFLFVNYMDAHLPYAAPEEYRRLFRSSAPDSGVASRSDLLDLVLTGKVVLTPEIRAELVDLYDAEIAYLDSMVGELLEALDDRGILDDCLLVITSDHGESLGEDGLVDHQLSLADRLLRVPVFMRWPGRIPAGQMNDEMVDQIEIHEAILEAADGGESPQEVFLSVPESDRVLLASYMRPLEIEERLARQIDAPDLFARRSSVRVRERGRQLELVTIGDGKPRLFATTGESGDPVAIDEPWNVDRLSSLRSRRMEGLRLFEESAVAADPGDPFDETSRRLLDTLGYVSGGPVPRGIGVHVAEHLHLGYLRLSENDSAAAARDFMLARVLDPDRAEAVFGLARSLEAIEPQRSRALYEEYLRRAARQPGEEVRCRVARERLELLGK